MLQLQQMHKSQRLKNRCDFSKNLHKYICFSLIQFENSCFLQVGSYSKHVGKSIWLSPCHHRWCYLCSNRSDYQCSKQKSDFIVPFYWSFNRFVVHSLLDNAPNYLVGCVIQKEKFGIFIYIILKIQKFRYVFLYYLFYSIGFFLNSH